MVITLGRQPHRPANWNGQRCGAGLFGARRMSGLVVLHLFDDRSGTRVSGGQPVQVTLEMLLHLALGLDHEPQTDRFAGTAGEQADSESARIPERIQQAGPRAELP